MVSEHAPVHPFLYPEFIPMVPSKHLVEKGPQFLETMHLKYAHSKSTGIYIFHFIPPVVGGGGKWFLKNWGKIRRKGKEKKVGLFPSLERLRSLHSVISSPRTRRRDYVTLQVTRQSWTFVTTSRCCLSERSQKKKTWFTFGKTPAPGTPAWAPTTCHYLQYDEICSSPKTLPLYNYHLLS